MSVKCFNRSISLVSRHTKGKGYLCVHIFVPVLKKNFQACICFVCVLQVPRKLEVLVSLGCKYRILFKGQDVFDGGSSENSGGQVPAVFFPALRQAQLELPRRENPGDADPGLGIVGVLGGCFPKSSPSLEGLILVAHRFPGEGEGDGAFAGAVEEDFSGQDLGMGLSAWQNLKSVRLDCGLSMFSRAFRVAEGGVLLPGLKELGVCFSQDVGRMGDVLDRIPQMFPNLKSLVLIHDVSEILATVERDETGMVVGGVVVEYSLYGSSFAVFNLVLKFQLRFPAIKVSFEPPPPESKVVVDDFYE